MLVDTPACDWLTITTHNKLESTILFNALAKHAKGRGRGSTSGRVMQYEGRVWEGAFFGEGVQRGRVHYLARSSGGTADYVLEELSKDCPGKATRIDLQYTICLPPGYSARNLYDHLALESNWKGRQRVPTLIQGVDGLDTVYVGSRHSDRYTRIYVKQGEGQRYLRFEVEYKGDYAETLYIRCCVGGRQAIGDILLTEISAMPYQTLGLSEIERSLTEHNINPVKHRTRVPDPNTTLAWILRQVSPAIIRLLRDHDTGDYMARAILEWYELAKELDRL